MNMRFYGLHQDSDLRNPPFLQQVNQAQSSSVARNNSHHNNKSNYSQNKEKLNQSQSVIQDKIDISLEVQSSLKQNKLRTYREIDTLKSRMQLLKLEQDKIKSNVRKLKDKTIKIYDQKIYEEIRKQQKIQNINKLDMEVRNKHNKTQEYRHNKKQLMEMIASNIQEQKKKEFQDMKIQQQKNEERIQREKHEFLLQKQNKRIQQQENLKKGQEEIDKFWIEKFISYKESKKQNAMDNENQLNNNLKMLSKLEQEEMKLIQSLEQTQNQQLKENQKLEYVYQNPYEVISENQEFQQNNNKMDQSNLSNFKVKKTTEQLENQLDISQAQSSTRKRKYVSTQKQS